VKGVNWDSRLHLFEKTISDSDHFKIGIMDSAYEIGIMGFLKFGFGIMKILKLGSGILHSKVGIMGIFKFGFWIL
jgi:hypothetical protein